MEKLLFLIEFMPPILLKNCNFTCKKTFKIQVIKKRCEFFYTLCYTRKILNFFHHTLRFMPLITIVISWMCSLWIGRIRTIFLQHYHRHTTRLNVLLFRILYFFYVVYNVSCMCKRPTKNIQTLWKKWSCQCVCSLYEHSYQNVLLCESFHTFCSSFHYSKLTNLNKSLSSSCKV